MDYAIFDTFYSVKISEMKCFHFQSSERWIWSFWIQGTNFEYSGPLGLIPLKDSEKSWDCPASSINKIMPQSIENGWVDVEHLIQRGIDLLHGLRYDLWIILSF